MAAWQDDPAALLGATQIDYLVAMNEDCDRNPPSPSDLDRWQSELGFDATMMTDPLRDVYGDYADANGCESGMGPGGDGCSNAVTIIIDKHMRIRHFGSTYECGTGSGNMCGESGSVGDAMCIEEVLILLQELLEEP